MEEMPPDLKAQKTNLLILGIVAFLITFPVIPILLYRFGIQNPNNVSLEKRIEIPAGSSASDVADLLYENGLIGSAFLFKTYLKLNNLEDSLQAGVYTVQPFMSIEQIAILLQKGYNDKKVTFVEGKRLEEYALQVAKVFPHIGFEEFMSKAKGKEGMLFPDTYYFTKDATAEDIVNKMAGTFVLKTKDLMSKNETDLTDYEIYTFASIVEREVRDPKDRPIVAGILIKRWKNQELIGADATTQYAWTSFVKSSDYWPKNITSEMLNFDSPYNTRKNTGLPPTPISSFGLAALQSVLNYQETDYYYYLSDADGKTHFAKTLAEHEANIKKYLN